MIMMHRHGPMGQQCWQSSSSHCCQGGDDDDGGGDDDDEDYGDDDGDDTTKNGDLFFVAGRKHEALELVDSQLSRLVGVVSPINANKSN